MYSVLYTGTILVSEGLDQPAVGIPFSVKTSGPVTESNLKLEVLKAVDRKFVCVRHLTYEMAIIRD